MKPILDAAELMARGYVIHNYDDYNAAFIAETEREKKEDERAKAKAKAEKPAQAAPDAHLIVDRLANLSNAEYRAMRTIAGAHLNAGLEQEGSLSLYLSGEINADKAAEIIEQLHAAPMAKQVWLGITGSGGDYESAHRIFGALRAHLGTVHTVARERCNGAARTVFMAGKRRWAWPGTTFTNHAFGKTRAERAQYRGVQAALFKGMTGDEEATKAFDRYAYVQVKQTKVTEAFDGSKNYTEIVSDRGGHVIDLDEALQLKLATDIATEDAIAEEFAKVDPQAQESYEITTGDGQKHKLPMDMSSVHDLVACWQRGGEHGMIIGLPGAYIEKAREIMQGKLHGE